MNIQIKALTEDETARLTGNANFNTLRPVRCPSCGNTDEFGRQVFRIIGVPKSDQNSDSIQDSITRHLRETCGIVYVFFKTHENRFYADSAVCRDCDSTAIMFDIELSDELLAEAAKLCGKSVEQVKTDMEVIIARIAAADLMAEQGILRDLPKPRTLKRL